MYKHQISCSGYYLGSWKSWETFRRDFQQIDVVLRSVNIGSKAEYLKWIIDWKFYEKELKTITRSYKSLKNRKTLKKSKEYKTWKHSLFLEWTERNKSRIVHYDYNYYKDNNFFDGKFSSILKGLGWRRKHVLNSFYKENPEQDLINRFVGECDSRLFILRQYTSSLYNIRELAKLAVAKKIAKK